MFQDENLPYVPYSYQDQGAPLFSTSASDATLDNPVMPTTPPQPQWSTLDATPTYHPHKPTRRAGRAGAIIGLTLMLALILGVGIFAGWEFSNKKSTTTLATTTSSTSSSILSTTSSSSGTSIETLQEAALAKIKPAVVELVVTTAQGKQSGSGVIIDTRGDIITNHHVISGAQTITALLIDGSSVKAQLVGSDAANDLAVVRITPFAHMVVAEIGDSSKLTVGQDVLAIGNPLGITETATKGMVSALNRSVQESTSVTISDAIQTDAAINPGNSGGALINLQGQLIGIPTLTAINTETNTPASGMGFAISSNRVKTALTQILQ